MDLYKEGILISVKVRFWIGIKTFTPNDFGLHPINLPCFGKKDLIPRNVIHKFRAIESKARFAIENNSFKFPIGNTRFLPQKRFKTVVNTLKKYKKDYSKLTEEFIMNLNNLRKELYPKHKEMATLIYKNYRHSLKLTEEEFIDHFFSILDTFYPDKKSLREKFSITWDVYEISFPKTRTINHNGYVEEFKNKIELFLNDTVTTLRHRIINLCTQILDKMDTGTVIKGTTIRSLKNLIDDFLDLNFIGDTVIENKINELKTDFIERHSIRQISENKILQKNLKNMLHLLLEQAQVTSGINTITKQYKEKIHWED